MYTSSLLFLASVLGLSASAAVGPNFQQAVYWGQAPKQARLSHFCDNSQGIDILPLGFLSQFGNHTRPEGLIGQCNITLSDEGLNSPDCQQLATDIEYCQSQNKVILLSLGGELGKYGLDDEADAENLAMRLWAMYGPLQKGYKGPRPLGNVSVDGFDFDIEHDVGANYYPFLVTRLRDLFANDPSKKYYISGAPQCMLPDANMGDMIFNAEFDYLFLQYYNTPKCSARGEISGYDLAQGADQYFTFDAWEAFTRTAPSKSVQSKLFIGLPGSTTAANKDQYLNPTEALKLITQYKSHAGFAGVMVWDAGSSDSNVVNGCTFSQQIANILQKGKTC
ncbi:hypothetical protein B7463_g2091, partial [Scytalidium lignicola]